MKHLIIVCLILLRYTVSAQSPQVKYYNYVNYGEYLKYKGENKKAYLMYQKAFKLDAHKHAKDYLAAASLCFSLNQPDSGLYYINIASRFEIGFQVSLLKSDSLMYSTIMGKEDWKTKLDEAIRINKIIRDSFEHDVATLEKLKKIESFVDSDGYYNKIRIKYFQLPADNVSRIKDQKNDSLFYERYYSYLATNGYPGYWVTNCNILRVVNVHCIWEGEGSLGERFKALFLKEYELGHMQTAELVYFIDRFDFEAKYKCGLGLYSAPYCDGERDWKKIVELRLKYGMSPYFFEPRDRFNTGFDLNKTVQYIDFKQLEEWY